MRKSVLLASAWLGAAAVPFASATAPAFAEATLDERLAEVERRLDLIDRKFGLLGATTEKELLGGEELLASPALLLARARAGVAERRLEEPYRLLTLIRTLHPESPEASEAYWLAAAIFQRQYSKNRLTNPDSPWVTTEPAFVFEWMGTFFTAEEAPTDRAVAVFRGMPLGIFRRFEAHAEPRPVFRPWQISVEEDNGIIEIVTMTPREAD